MVTNSKETVSFQTSTSLFPAYAAFGQIPTLAWVVPSSDLAWVNGDVQIKVEVQNMQSSTYNQRLVVIYVHFFLAGHRCKLYINGKDAGLNMQRQDLSKGSYLDVTVPGLPYHRHRSALFFASTLITGLGRHKSIIRRVDVIIVDPQGQNVTGI